MSPTLIRTTAAALAAVILLLLLVWALRPQPTQGTTGVNDAVQGQVFQVAVDTDTTGNPPGSGGLLSDLDGITPKIPVGMTRDIDIIVDEVHASDGMSGFSLELGFDPAIVTITAKNHNSFMLPGGFEILPPPIPNTSGDLRMDVAQIGANVSGEGVLVRFTIECIANGASLLDLKDDLFGGNPDIVDSGAAELNVLNATDGQIVCGTGTPLPPSPTPPPPTATPTPTPTASPTPVPTPTPTASPIPTATPIPTDTPTPGPPTSTPTATATPGGPTSTGPTPPPGSATPTATATATPPATPAPSSVTWGNIDCLAGIGPVDALKLLRFDAGLSASQADGCPPLGSEITIADAQLAGGE